jgi:hypothetical protein
MITTSSLSVMSGGPHFKGLRDYKKPTPKITSGTREKREK